LQVKRVAIRGIVPNQARRNKPDQGSHKSFIFMRRIITTYNTFDSLWNLLCDPDLCVTFIFSVSMSILPL